MLNFHAYFAFFFVPVYVVRYFFSQFLVAVTNCSECSVRIFGSLQRINSCIIRCQAENQSSRELRLSSRCETWQLIFTAEFCNASCKFKNKQSHPTLDLPLWLQFLKSKQTAAAAWSDWACVQRADPACSARKFTVGNFDSLFLTNCTLHPTPNIRLPNFARNINWN